MSKSKMIVRTKFIDRACHWTVVICFFLVALSGISFFFPTLQWLTQTFGTPQMGRILHLHNAHVYSGSSFAVRGDCMQCKSGLCCRQQGIVTVFWFCAWPASAALPGQG